MSKAKPRQLFLNSIDEFIKCPACKYFGDESDFDTAGGCDGNLFCNQCGAEFSVGIAGEELHSAKDCKICQAMADQD